MNDAVATNRDAASWRMRSDSLGEADLSERHAAMKIMASRAGERMQRAALLAIEGMSIRAAARAAGYQDHKTLWRFLSRHGLLDYQRVRHRDILLEERLFSYVARGRRVLRSGRKPRPASLIALVRDCPL